MKKLVSFLLTFALIITLVPVNNGTSHAKADASYKGYLSFQTDNYAFRDPWDADTFGLNSNYLDYNSQIGYWSATHGGKFYLEEVSITNADITTDNVAYTVRISGINFYDLYDISDVNAFNMLSVSTNIPKTIKGVTAKATVVIDGKTIAKDIAAPDKGDQRSYYNFMICDCYSPEDGTDDDNLAYSQLDIIPTSEISITFTISGLTDSSGGGTSVGDNASGGDNSSAGNGSSTGNNSATGNAIDKGEYDDEIFVYCYPSQITLIVGQKKALLAEIEDDYGTDNELIWWSNNSAVASVDNNGVVTAKSEGIATIFVEYGNSQDKCDVIVKKKTPTYKQAVKKLKSLSKKNKKFKFRNVKAGNVCRLYAEYGIGHSDSTKWYSQGFMSGVVFGEYIEIKKKGSGSVAKLVVEGGMIQMSYLERVELSASELKLSTSNRKLSFDLSEINSKSYRYKKAYCGESRAKSTIASSADGKSSTFKKYNKMLGQNSFTLKFLCEGDAFHKVKATKKSRKSWKKLSNTYSQLLEIY